MSNQPQYSNEELANAWIRRYSKNRTRILSVESADRQLQDDRRIETETWWAFEEFHKLVDNDPARAWAVILCILGLAVQDQPALDNLAAGPLESLLVRHGPHIVEWVEKEAESNPGLKDLLLGVWGDAVDPKVWQRVEALLGASTDSEEH